MMISRYLNEASIKIEMETVIEPLPDDCVAVDKWRQHNKEIILNELVSLLVSGNHFGNFSKLLTDFVNRERKASTGIGEGIAIPHIRTMQAKQFMIAFARSSAGYDFDSFDKQPSHLFFVMAAPPYDDSLYLKVFKSLSEMFQYDSFRDELMKVSSPGEVIRVIRSME